MSHIMIPLIDKQIAVAVQRRQLEKLRDLLLPKIMRGEIKVLL
jgi:type I restriction enzyme S subunit